MLVVWNNLLAKWLRGLGLGLGLGLMLRLGPGNALCTFSLSYKLWWTSLSSLVRLPLMIYLIRWHNCFKQGELSLTHYLLHQRNLSTLHCYCLVQPTSYKEGVEWHRHCDELIMLSFDKSILSTTTVCVAVCCIWISCLPQVDTHCSSGMHTCLPQLKLLPQDVSCTGSHTPPSLSWGTTFGIEKCSGLSDLSEMLGRRYAQWGSENSPKTVREKNSGARIVKGKLLQIEVAVNIELLALKYYGYKILPNRQGL